MIATKCIYTILHPDRLAEAASLRGPSTFVILRRMLAAAKLLNEATSAGEAVAILFGDATNCSRLLYWGQLTAISVGKSDTHYTVFPIHRLAAGHKPQELSLVSTRKRIADGFIRPYAVCITPRFVERAMRAHLPAD